MALFDCEVTLLAPGKRLLPGTKIPGSETWDAFCDGGPRNSEGGGSRSLPFFDEDILTSKDLK